MNLIQSIGNYFRGVYSETKKVSWPTFPQMLKYVLSVILGLLLATAFVGGVDYLFITYLLPLFIK